MTKRDPPGKTRRFLLMALPAFLFLSLLYIGLKFVSVYWWDLRVTPKDPGLLSQIANALLFPIIALPIIMFMAIVLKLVERLIDRF